jgi:hypothetical protein
MRLARRVQLLEGTGVLLAVGALCACGSSPATHAAPPPVRASIVRLLTVQFAHLQIQGGQAAVARIDVGPVRLAGADTHFAVTAITPKDAKGHVLDNSAAVVLMETGGAWSVILGPGTAFPEECSRPTPHSIRQLLCPDPFTVLGLG